MGNILQRTIITLPQHNNTTLVSSASSSASASSCGLYLAPSSIPNAGFGLFAGRDYQNNETFSASYVVPMLLYSYFNKDKPQVRDKVWNILEDYYWEAYESTTANSFLEAEDVKLMINDFGAMANHHVLYENIGHNEVKFSEPKDAILNRWNSPAAGSFTYYYREFFTKRDVKAGEELFVHYGDSWTNDRTEYGILSYKDYMNAIYVLGRMIELLRDLDNDVIDFDTAVVLIKKIFRHGQGDVITKAGITAEPDKYFLRNCSKYANYALGRFGKDQSSITSDEIVKQVHFILSAVSTSIANHFPDNFEDAEFLHLNEITAKFMPNRHPSLEWLEKNGSCYDSIYRDRSTIDIAGDGAFASKDLSKGAVVAPMPFIHVFNKRNMDMFMWQDVDGNDVLTENKISHQLMLNYCLAHNHSTILLCIMSTAAFVNHKSARNCANEEICPEGPNVEYRWAEWDSTNSWIDSPFVDIHDEIYGNSRGLSMELVALRDISLGEEIFMDYGDEWEDAWRDHVDNWKPPEGNFSLYRSVDEFIDQWNDAPLLTMDELQETPYPPNIGTLCLCRPPRNKCRRKRGSLGSEIEYVDYNVNYTINENIYNIYDHSIDGSDFFVGSRTDKLEYLPCQVVNRSNDNEHYLVRIFVIEDDEATWVKKDQPCFIQNLPRASITFGNRPYTSDQWLPSAFRHPLVIKDDIFPEHWKNLKK